mgnify:CR=1 FL=1
MRKIIVTGGCGFIGSEFVRQGVKRGYNIVVLDNLTYAGDIERIKEVKSLLVFYKIDITDKDGINSIFQKERPDFVVHFAAESHVDRSILDPEPFLETNIKGTYNLLEASRKNNVQRFINISTDEVYGELEEKGQFYETTPLNPNSPYSVTKASADMLGRAYHRTYGLPLITVRPSNNYGPWQYPEKLIPVIILKALNNEKVPVYGKGLNIREWIYVSDCVEGVFTILENGIDGEIYNIGSGEEKRNIEVVKTILSLMGKSDELIEFVKDRPGHDFRYSLNSDKIRKGLGWIVKTPFEEGIKRTINWYLNNIDWAKKKLETKYA